MRKRKTTHSPLLDPHALGCAVEQIALQYVEAELGVKVEEMHWEVIRANGPPHRIEPRLRVEGRDIDGQAFSVETTLLWRAVKRFDDDGKEVTA